MSVLLWLQSHNRLGYHIGAFAGILVCHSLGYALYSAYCKPRARLFTARVARAASADCFETLRLPSAVDVVLLPTDAQECERHLADVRAIVSAAGIVGLDTEWQPERPGVHHKCAPHHRPRHPVQTCSTSRTFACNQQAVSATLNAAACRIAVLQLSSVTTCWVLQPLHVGHLPPALRAILQDPKILKMGVGIREDVRRLEEDYQVAVKVRLTSRDQLLARCWVPCHARASRL
jgi:hypothetical protein